MGNCPRKDMCGPSECQIGNSEMQISWKLFTTGLRGIRLANWVDSVATEEWTGEISVGEMRRTLNGEGEMLNLLQNGLGCCEVDMNKRWELRDVVEKIEKLKERNAD